MPSKRVDEFLGLDVEVKDSTNMSLKGLSGRIVGETMKTFEIRTRSGTKVVAKRGSIFRIRMNSGEVVELRGDDVLRRLEERSWRYEVT